MTRLTSEPGGPIDASGELADGTKIDGVVTLRNAVLNRPTVFVGTMTEKLLTYALGRGLGYADMPVVRTIVREAGRNDYKFSSLVLGVINSMPFQMRIRPAESEPPPISAARAEAAGSPNSIENTPRPQHVRRQRLDVQPAARHRRFQVVVS